MLSSTTIQELLYNFIPLLICSPLFPVKTGTDDSSAAGSPPDVPTHVNVPASAFPSISQHLCTCTAVSESTATAMLEKYQQLPSSSAVPQQQQSAPAQQTYSQQSAQQTSSAQASAQSGSYSTTVSPIQLSPSADHFVRPAYAASNKVTGY